MRLAQISQNEFQKLNWLPNHIKVIKINQYVLLTTFSFINKVFQWIFESNGTL